MEETLAKRAGRTFSPPTFTLVSFVLGFAYVAVALCGRSNPLQSENLIYSDLVIMLLWGVIFHYAAIGSALRRDEEANRRRAVWLWLAGYAGGLHIAFFENMFSLHFALTAHSLSRAEPHILVFLVLLVILVVWLAVLHIRWASREGIIRGYLLALALFPALIVVVSKLAGPRTYLHIHHYFWAALLIPFVRFPTTISTLCCGICCGICVEGASRWGLDPVWVFRY